MIIDFENIEEKVFHHLNDGKGDVLARMCIGDYGKILKCRLEKGSSIGMHIHETNSEAEYIIAGQAKFICDGKTEILGPGMCHYCPNGSEHSMESIGEEDLEVVCVVLNCK